MIAGCANPATDHTAPPVTPPCLLLLCPAPRLCFPDRRSYSPRPPVELTLVAGPITLPTGCVTSLASSTAPPGGHTALPAARLPCTPVLPLTLSPRPLVVPPHSPATPPRLPVPQPCPLFVTLLLPFVPSHPSIVLLRPLVMPLCLHTDHMALDRRSHRLVCRLSARALCCVVA